MIRLSKIRLFMSCVYACCLSFALSNISMADDVYSAGSTPGAPGTTWNNGPTLGNYYGPSMPTLNQGMMNGVMLPPTQTTYLAYPNSLQPTVLDSFVQGGGNMVYGDEGTNGPPPFNDFGESHRIEAGITSGGLTTGHQSGLPEAWGYPN